RSGAADGAVRPLDAVLGFNLGRIAPDAGDDRREAQGGLAVRRDQTADIDQAAACAGHFPGRFDDVADAGGGQEVAGEIHGDARPLNLVLGDGEAGIVGKRQETAAVHEAAAVHVTLFGDEPTDDLPGLVPAVIKRPY